MGRRWTEARRRVLVESRVQLTQQLVSAIAEARPCPKTLISGCAVGYYGDRGGAVLHEWSHGSNDFLARLREANGVIATSRLARWGEVYSLV